MIILQISLWMLFALIMLVCLILFMKFSVQLKYGEQNAVILGLGIVRINLTKLRQRRENRRRKPKIRHLKKSLPKKTVIQNTVTDTKPQTEKNAALCSTEKTQIQTQKALPHPDTKPETKENANSEQKAGIGKMLRDFVKGKSLSENLSLLKQILVQTSQRFSKYATIKVKKLRVTVSLPEAADTAVLFGIANGVVCSAIGIIESFSVFSIEKNAVGVYQDYLSGRSSFEVDILFSMRVFRLVSCALPALKTFTTKGKNPHQRSNDK